MSGVNQVLAGNKRAKLVPVGHTAVPGGLPPLEGVMRTSLPLMCPWEARGQVEKSSWSLGWIWGEIHSFPSSALT